MAGKTKPCDTDESMIMDTIIIVTTTTMVLMVTVHRDNAVVVDVDVLMKTIVE